LRWFHDGSGLEVESGWDWEVQVTLIDW
jgi:hypothetical protein